MAIIIKYDIPNATQTGNMIDVSCLASATAYAGGLFIEAITGMTGVSLGGMIQNDQVFGLELGYANTLVGIDEPERTGLSVYPNPVRDFLHLEIPLEECCQVHITDLLGQIVFSKKTWHKGHQDHDIPMRNLTDGVYYITVTSCSGKRLTKPFVKAGK